MSPQQSQSAKRVITTRSELEALKPVISALYLKQDMKLSELRDELARRYGFTARLVSVSHSGSI